ncbi:MAG: sulfatase-like hydrolase/transferase [Actinomycetota bacterium]
MIRRISLLAVVAIVLGVAPSTARASTPAITTTSPRHGPVGTKVFIKGSGFTGTTAVAFNGTAATFTVRSDVSIRTYVPGGATTGPVTVTGDSTAQSPAPFVVQPNIVLILTDDQRYDQLDHMPIVQSELIGKGTDFTNGFVVDPLCCPSRATILTGKYSHGTDVYSNIYPHGSFRTFVTDNHEDRSTIATWLQKIGYDTGLVGKYLNGYSVKKASYVSPGWNTWDALALNAGGGGEGTGGYYNYDMSIQGVDTQFGSDPSDYSTDVLSSQATDFIRSAPASQPLFLYFAPRAPHGPATPPDRYADALPDLPPFRPAAYNEDDVTDKPAYVQAVAPWSDTTQATEDAFVRNEYQSLLAVDDAVGNIIQALRDTGRLEDTLIVFTSDNGLELGEHRWKAKKVPYEESIRVPIIARYDALMHGTASTDPSLVLNLDLAPTFAAAGGATATGVEGMNMMPLLDGSASSWRSDFLVEHMDPRVVQVPAYCAVRNSDEIYIKYQDGFEELYDLRTDPYELTNVANDPLYELDKAALYQRLLELCQPPPPGYTP